MKTPKKIIALFLASAMAIACLIPMGVFADTENEEIRVSVQLTPDWEGHDLTITTVQNGEPVSAIATADNTGTVTFNVPSTDQYSVAVRGDEIAPADEILVSNIPGATLVEEGDVTFTLDLGPSWSGTVFSLYTTLDAYIRAFAADESGVVTLHANSSTAYDIMVATANDITDSELSGGTADEGETTTSGDTTVPEETAASGEDTLVGALGSEDEGDYEAIPSMSTEGETNGSTSTEGETGSTAGGAAEEEEGGIDIVVVGTIIMACALAAFGAYTIITRRRRNNSEYENDDDDDIYSDQEDEEDEEDYEDDEYSDEDEDEYDEEEEEEEEYDDEQEEDSEEEYEDYEDEEEQYEEEEEEYEEPEPEPEPEPVKKPTPKKSAPKKPAPKGQSGSKSDARGNTQNQDIFDKPSEDIFDIHNNRANKEPDRASRDTTSTHTVRRTESEHISTHNEPRHTARTERTVNTGSTNTERTNTRTEHTSENTTQRQSIQRTRHSDTTQPIEEALNEPVKRPTHQTPPRRRTTDDDDEWD